MPTKVRKPPAIPKLHLASPSSVTWSWCTKAVAMCGKSIVTMNMRRFPLLTKAYSINPERYCKICIRCYLQYLYENDRTLYEKEKDNF